MTARACNRLRVDLVASMAALRAAELVILHVRSRGLAHPTDARLSSLRVEMN